MMLPSALRVFVATRPIDLRISFDRLAGIVREQFGDDPRSGALFVFVNKASDRCKVLVFDRTGYCVLYKRLDAGTFVLPVADGESEPRVSVEADAFARFLEGVATTSTAASRRRRLHS